MKSTQILWAAALVLPLTASVLPAQNASRSVWDGVYTADQSARGQALVQAKCASCHGGDLSGHEMAPALAGGIFLGNWSGQSVGDLATRIKTTMPQNDPGSLRNREVADLIAFILSANQFPAGSNELPSDPLVLQQISVDAEKPKH
jgi:mono/diheme cytochrome c family protein